MQFFIKRLKYLHSGVCSSSKGDLCFFFFCQEPFTSSFIFGCIEESSSALTRCLRYVIINSNFVVRPWHSMAFKFKLWVFSIGLHSNLVKVPLELIINRCMITNIMVEVILIKPVPICLFKRNQFPFWTFILVIDIVTSCFFLKFSSFRKDFIVPEPGCLNERHCMFDLVFIHFILI
jgi:hypothetical protein